jgi:hypothetical protein
MASPADVLPLILLPTGVPLSQSRGLIEFGYQARVVIPSQALQKVPQSAEKCPDSIGIDFLVARVDDLAMSARRPPFPPEGGDLGRLSIQEVDFGTKGLPALDQPDQPLVTAAVSTAMLLRGAAG